MGDITELAKGIKLEHADYFANEGVENPKVSIVVPAFNVQDYIEDCLASLIRQTLRDIEIIVIDDGSYDLTPTIIHMFKGDRRIRVYTQGTSGPSLARNKGINLAKGEYIAFVDADDWVDNDFIEKLYNAAKNTNSDIAAATIIRKRENSQKYRVHYTEEKIYQTLEEKIKICDIPTCCYVWNKIYKADFIKNFKFKVGAFFEDVLWIPEVLKQANQLVTVPDTNYYYRVNNNSIVKKLPSKKKQEDSYNSKKYVVKFFDENNLYLSPKGRNLTKRIYYFLKVPVLKIKEFENIETFLLFGILPIGRKNVQI
ncbi:MAG: glycosyltransferase family 2 protein [Candidatus Gastranaerophilales bacterium]|nr:glycosyltransferase family 2 protein [Candidatus Gastranaerophilales bacterium]